MPRETPSFTKICSKHTHCIMVVHWPYKKRGGGGGGFPGPLVYRELDGIPGVLVTSLQRPPGWTLRGSEATQAISVLLVIF